MDKFKPILTHLVAFILGLGIMYLSGRSPDPQETKQEAKEIAREAAAVALSAARESATAALASAAAPIPEVAGAAIEAAQGHIESQLDTIVEKAADAVLPGGYYQQFIGDWNYAAVAASKYAQGTLKIEAGRKNKAGIVDTPYNLTFVLKDAQGRIFEGGFGFYETGRAFGKTDEGDPKAAKTHRDAQVALKKVGSAGIALDIAAIGLSEHFEK
jgi:hypothetical protein